MTKTQKGFTLVELMIVVAIIGVLAAVAIPKFAQMLEKSREGATKGNLSALKSATSNYFADQQGTYPYTLDTQTYINANASASYPAFLPQYLDQISPVKVTFQSTYAAVAQTQYYSQGPGVGTNAASITTGQWGVPNGFSTINTGFGWRYDHTGGSVWVNSELVDMSNNSYTTFGYQ